MLIMYACIYIYICTKTAYMSRCIFLPNVIKADSIFSHQNEDFVYIYIRYRTTTSMDSKLMIYGISVHMLHKQCIYIYIYIYIKCRG